MKNNIIYKTDQLSRYFSTHRVVWKQFYKSERVIIEQLQPTVHHSVLDVGCGCGGLGLALRDQFGVEHYSGVEINQKAAKLAQKMNARAMFYCSDILELAEQELSKKQFHIVFSLSCIDWNIQFSDMLAAIWKLVSPGGSLVATFRLTADDGGCDDMQRSYQYINSECEMTGERAAYVVLNADALMHKLAAYSPSEINAYGYWGKPSSTAVTPYNKLCFTAFSIKKRQSGEIAPVCYRLNLPPDILRAISNS